MKSIKFVRHIFEFLLMYVLATFLAGCAKGEVLYNIDPEKGGTVKIFNLTTGKDVSITENADVERVIGNLNDVRWQSTGEIEEGLVGGGSYEVVIYASGVDPFYFILDQDQNGSPILRHNGKYWKEASGSFDYDFIVSLADEAS